MEYYALQVKTRAEDKFMRLFCGNNPETSVSLHFPRRRLSVRRKGVVANEVAPVFPGYIFIETEGKIPTPEFWALRRTDGFYRFLKSNQDVRPLTGKDLRTVLHFLRLGPVAEKSKVFFDENDKISVVEGPLKGLEGSIIKVDKRKGRAKIKLDLYGDSFSIDLAFEMIGRL